MLYRASCPANVLSRVSDTGRHVAESITFYKNDHFVDIPNVLSHIQTPWHPQLCHHSSLSIISP